MLWLIKDLLCFRVLEGVAVKDLPKTTSQCSALPTALFLTELVLNSVQIPERALY